MSPSRASAAPPVVVLVAGALGALTLVGCGSSGSSAKGPGPGAPRSTSTVASTDSTGETTASTVSSSTGSTAVRSAGPDGVNIANYAFVPATLTVKAGTSVSWVNRDQFAHEVISDSSDPGPAFDLGQQASGATVTHVFTAPGTYHYYCNIHNYMKGTIVVTP